MTSYRTICHRLASFSVLLAFALACVAMAPSAMASGPRAVAPGEWQWRLTESSTFGSKTFVTMNCVKTGQHPIFGGDAQAVACYHNEKLIDGPGNAVTYAFHCVSSNGPSTADSTGHYVVHVSRDGGHATLSGSILTDASFPGMSAIKIHSSVQGHGTRTGACQ